MSGGKIDKDSKFIMPKLKAGFFYEVSKYIKSALDISDGLFFELERLSRANKVGFDFFADISKDTGCSGEEYEIVFTFEKKNETLILEIAKKHGVKLNIFAKTQKGEFICPCKSHHFNS